MLALGSCRRRTRPGGTAASAVPSIPRTGVLGSGGVCRKPSSCCAAAERRRPVRRSRDRGTCRATRSRQDPTDRDPTAASTTLLVDHDGPRRAQLVESGGASRAPTALRRRRPHRLADRAYLRDSAPGGSCAASVTVADGRVRLGRGSARASPRRAGSRAGRARRRAGRHPDEIGASSRPARPTQSTPRHAASTHRAILPRALAAPRATTAATILRPCRGRSSFTRWGGRRSCASRTCPIRRRGRARRASARPRSASTSSTSTSGRGSTRRRAAVRAGAGGRPASSRRSGPASTEVEPSAIASPTPGVPGAYAEVRVVAGRAPGAAARRRSTTARRRR